MADERAIVITGASTGIGRACVEKAVREGAHVFAAVRKQADSDKLKQEFGDRVTPLILDVTNGEQIAAAAALVSARLHGRTLFGLLNNAGIAVSGPLPHQPVDDVRRQFETNFFGVHAVTQEFLPLLGSDRTRQGAPGRIVMISSVGGREAFPFTGAYAASKHALEGYSQALRRELMLFGIGVVVLAPGAIVTPIWDKAEQGSELAAYANTPYGKSGERTLKVMTQMGRQGLKPSIIGDYMWRAMTLPKPRFRYTILRNKFTGFTLPRMLPERLFNGLIAKQLALTPPR